MPALIVGIIFQLPQRKRPRHHAASSAERHPANSLHFRRRSGNRWSAGFGGAAPVPRQRRQRHAGLPRRPGGVDQSDARGGEDRRRLENAFGPAGQTSLNGDARLRCGCLRCCDRGCLSLLILKERRFVVNNYFFHPILSPWPRRGRHCM